MEKSLHDTLDELIKSIKSFAEESYDTGQPMDSADFDEFKKSLMHEDEFMDKLCSQLFSLYFEHFENCKEN